MAKPPATPLRFSPPIPSYGRLPVAQRMQSEQPNPTTRQEQIITFSVSGENFTGTVCEGTSDAALRVALDPTAKKRLRTVAPTATFRLGPVVEISRSLIQIQGSQTVVTTTTAPEKEEEPLDLSNGYKYRAYHFSDRDTLKSTEYIHPASGKMQVTSHGHGSGIYAVDPTVFDKLDPQTQRQAVSRSVKDGRDTT